jgi:tricarballylate dehydrogenase
MLYILANDTGGPVGERYDVVVVGAGNAAFCAAQAARELVGKVLVLEKAPEGWLGGNSYFTAGSFRVTFGGIDDLRPLLDEMDEDRLGRTVLPAYETADFMADMQRVTGGVATPGSRGSWSRLLR